MYNVQCNLTEGMLDGNSGEGVNEMDPVLAMETSLIGVPDQPGGITMGIGSTRRDSR